ncbi:MULTISPECIES: AEC family transporter [Anaerotruncus]|jgi:predicted permease|uniref:AEC family transporter n=1 Tax=Anaerotruncus TaxID=244127 RepID=UPI000834D433|nr:MULTISPECIES: AEC family transporter [Anaerotruncus]RGX54361.1 hypothetical protein DWV16_14395 [Anaerotruncus sp. AF02-27]
MSIGIILAKQVAVITLLMAVGIFAKKRGILNLAAAKNISDFVLIVITPMLMLQIILEDFAVEKFRELGIGMVVAAIFHLMAIGVTKLLIRPDPSGIHNLERFGAICSNAGFMGLPLMVAVLGPEGRVHSAAFLTVMTVYFWTHGLMLIKGDKGVSAKEILTAPGIVGLAAGLAIFFLGIRLPEPAMHTIDYLASMNTPLPTIITGVFVADLDFKKAFTNLRAYWAVAVRLLVLPGVFILLLWLLRVPYWLPGGGTIALAAVISCCCTCAANTVMMPVSYGGDVQHGASLVVMSMLGSLVTIPLVATVAEMVFL